MTAREIVAQVKNLPVVSQAALKLVSLLDQPAVGNDDIVNVLRYDNVLTAKLLRTCNSSYFGFEDGISSVEQAVLILGHQQILHLVLGLAFGGAMTTSVPGFAVETRALWTHSLAAAVVAEQLAKSNIPVDTEPPVAFTAGLLHDIGKLAFHHALNAGILSDLHARLDATALSGIEVEREITGTDHTEVGAQLLEAWHLPAVIIEATANHHHPCFTPQPHLSVVIHVADGLAHGLDQPAGWEIRPGTVDARVNAALDLTPEKYETLRENSRQVYQEVEQFMNLN